MLLHLEVTPNARGDLIHRTHRPISGGKQRHEASSYLSFLCTPFNSPDATSLLSLANLEKHFCRNYFIRH